MLCYKEYLEIIIVPSHLLFASFFGILGRVKGGLTLGTQRETIGQCAVHSMANYKSSKNVWLGLKT